MKDDVSYDRLNALVDGELDRFEAGRAFDAIHRDPGLERRVGELRLIKDLVRHAYQQDEVAGRRGIAIPGAATGAGWPSPRSRSLPWAWAPAGTAMPGSNGTGTPTFRGSSHRVGAVAQVAAADRIVLHVSSSAPERVSAMLDDAEGMLRAARADGRPIAIEILANNTGLDVLRIDVPGPSMRLAALRAENPNLTLVACGQTIERLRERGVDVQLLPETVVATSALDEVVKRVHGGWTYVRT